MTLFGGQQQGTVPAPRPPLARPKKGGIRSTCPVAPSWVRSGASLAPFKVTPMVEPGALGGEDRPYMGGCCARCTPHSKKAHTDPQVMQLGIRNLLLVSTMDRDRGFLARTFCYLSHAATRDIRLPPRPVSSRAVLEADAVQVALEQTLELTLEARGLADVPEAEHHVRRLLYARAESLLSAMKSNIGTAFLRVATWALFHLLRCTLSSAQVHKGQLEAVRRAQQASPGTPVVFLPLHKSHLDYVLLSFALTNFGVQAPLVAAGDNLCIPLFGWLLSRLGAFYVKRRLDGAGPKDLIYRAILQSYMVEALALGHNMEFFIEGGRSRNGRPKRPKAGLLSVVVHAFHEQRIDDALVVPVGISYERIVDGNFISEQLGRPKQAETLGAALSAIWAVLRGRHGAVRLDLAQPFKLSEFLSTARCSAPPPPPAGDGAPLSSSPESRTSASSLYGLDVVDPQQRSAVNALAEHVVYDAARCCAVMSTQLVALLLLHRFRQGCTLSALTNAFAKARDELLRRGVDVGFRGDAHDVVQYAIGLLGPGLVTHERMQMGGAAAEGRPPLEVTFVRPVTILPNVLELAYYANMAVHSLCLDAVLVSGLLSLLSVDLAAAVDLGPSPDLEVGRHQVLAAACDLADLLRDELLLTPPCSRLDDALVEPLSRLTSAEVLVAVEPKLVDESEEWASRAFSRFKAQELQTDSEDEADCFGTQSDTFWMVQLTADTLEHVLYLQSIVAPLVDTYYTTACCLHRLVTQELAEADFVLDVLYEIKNKLMLGMLAYVV
ncbi:glycerol-3-phosphate acyltransferase 1, mitochondrial-like [Pollicipes pollicipes]|uniref:glycerol-3-phosphate acyltransferase 1, mitochondrial-like n=1 Tax=Pollicipes pollicipes TaxID=41117 RepID=UPI001884FA1A|nr:glycerol-3-phosphate acyltransferase 1, mitochondrial-like [Pollicipes pollicipes]